MAPHRISCVICGISSWKYLVHAWHFHETWYFLRHDTSTRCDISMRLNARRTSHADVLLITIRDPSNLAIELCNTCLFERPSISLLVQLSHVRVCFSSHDLYLPCNCTSYSYYTYKQYYLLNK